MKTSIYMAVAIAAAAMTSCSPGSSDMESKVELVPVEVSDGRWSFVDADGNVVFENHFTQCPTLVYNGFFSSNEHGELAIYKASVSGGYEVVGSLGALKEAGYMEDGLIPATFPGERICLFDETGEKRFELTPIEGNEIIWCAAGYSEGLLPFCSSDGRHGYFGIDGNVAIKPAYDMVSSFGEGLAVVGKKADTDGMMLYSVINRKGEVVFKLRQATEPRIEANNPAFRHGYMIATSGNRDIIYDTDGTVVTLPSEARHIQSTDGKFVIFADTDGQYGVCTLKGDIVVTPQYGPMDFAVDGSGFIAEDDGECVVLSEDGDEKARLNFVSMKPFGKFGYFAFDGKCWTLVDEDGNPKSKQHFDKVSELGISRSPRVATDYFNYSSVAGKVVGLIGTAGVGDFRFGTSPAEILKDESPKDYLYAHNIAFNGLKREGHDYRLSGRGFFTGPIALGEYDHSTYAYECFWNRKATLYGINLSLQTASPWGKEGFEALVNELKARGFTEVAEGHVRGTNQGALFTNGDIAVGVTFSSDGQKDTLIVLDMTTEKGQYTFSELQTQIKP